MNIFLRPEEAMIEIWQKLVFQQFNCSVFVKIIPTYILPNRMRNIHTYIESEHGKETVQILRCWEKLEYKMADFENH